MTFATEERAVYVVGGGPAGLATAIAMRLEGLPVKVADCGHPPIDKSCGEGLMPDTITALGALGIELPENAGYPLKGITFIDNDRTVTADFSSNIARGLRRTVLHELLTRRAKDVGVELLWGARVERVSGGSIVIDGREHQAAYVIGADGQNSRIRRDAGLAPAHFEQTRYGFRRHYRMSPWSNHVQLYWGSKCQLYVTPVAPDELGVALISDDPHLRLSQALMQFPELRERLEGVEHASKEMGSITASRNLRNVRRTNIALVGDASGSVDAITGEGMSLAFQQALALAAACKAGDLFQYELTHRELRQRPSVMAGLMLLLARHEELRRRAFASLARRPEMFRQLLAVHIGESSFKDLLSWQLLPLSAAFLTA
jgi:flavin-dependent dehydrogenase